MHAALVVLEDVFDDAVGNSVFDIHAAALQAVRHFAIALKVVSRDQRILRVASPDAANCIFDQSIAVKDIAKRESHLDPVCRGV